MQITMVHSFDCCLPIIGFQHQVFLSNCQEYLQAASFQKKRQIDKMSAKAVIQEIIYFLIMTQDLLLLFLLNDKQYPMDSATKHKNVPRQQKHARFLLHSFCEHNNLVNLLKILKRSDMKYLYMILFLNYNIPINS